MLSLVLLFFNYLEIKNVFSFFQAIMSKSHNGIYEPIFSVYVLFFCLSLLSEMVINVCVSVHRAPSLHQGQREEVAGPLKGQGLLRPH